MQRIEVPIPDCQVQRNKTVLKNFGKLHKAFRRDPKHLSKYLSKKPATQSRIQGDTLLLYGQFSSDVVKAAVEGYLREVVCCARNSICYI